MVWPGKLKAVQIRSDSFFEMIGRNNSLELIWMEFNMYGLCRIERQVEKDAEKVRDAAAQNKQVPDGMIVRDSFTGIEDDSGGVKQAADNKPFEHPRRKRFHHGLECKNGHPAHDHVNNDGNNFIFPDIHGFKYQAAHGHGPDECEKRPSPGAAHGDQCGRCVCSCY